MAIVVAHRRALTVVFVAGGVSSFGTQMTMLALPWLVLESTGSATRTGVVFAVQVLPMALLGFFGGEVIQRFGAHRTMLVGDAARAPVVALVPLLYAFDALSFGALLTIVAVLGVFAVPYYASQRILAVELIGDDPRALTRANSVMESIYNATAFGGPAVAGALISVLGAEKVLWIDAATFAVSWMLLLLFVPRVTGSARSASGGPPGIWAGLRRLREDSFLGQSVISTVLYGFLLRILAIALPLLAFDRFDRNAAVGGLLVASSGAGALIGSFVTYLVSSRVSPSRLVAISGVLLALPLWLLVLPSASAGLLIVAVAVSSAAVPLSNAPYFGILAARVPAEFRPKVLQAVITISNIAGPLGFLVAGFMTDRAGITTTLFLVAALATLSTVNIFVALRRLDSPTNSAPPQTVARVH